MATDYDKLWSASRYLSLNGPESMKYLAWFGTLVSILGSFLVASKVFGVGYICFTLGSLAWLIVAYKKGDKPLGFLNAVFFIANLLGLYNNF